MAAIEGGGKQTDFTTLLKYGAPPAETDKILNIVRNHLGMDVAFISRFGEVTRVLEHVVGEVDCPLVPGQSLPLEEGYCLKIVQGELPQLIPDTSQVPATLDIPATRQLPIGAHLSVPIQLENGHVYGTLCCFNHLPIPRLGAEDLRLVRALSDVLAANIDRAHEEKAAALARQLRIQALISQEALKPVYQPIYAVATGKLFAFECLSRFPSLDPTNPDFWFKSAHEVGLSDELQLHAIERALAPTFSEWDDLRLNINSSPELIASGKLLALLQDTHFKQIVVEVTEHDVINDYAPVIKGADALRSHGIKLAIDDAGAGIASMRHVLLLKPDVVKLDMSIVRGVDKDPARQSLIEGLVRFCHDQGATVTAEGVETKEELEALSRLGVDRVQGFYLGKPRDLSQALTQTNAYSNEVLALSRHTDRDMGD
ncbi:MAG: EAL domain-containing protein [Rhodocyclaceae bacterium]